MERDDAIELVVTAPWADRSAGGIAAVDGAQCSSARAGGRRVRWPGDVWMSTGGRKEPPGIGPVTQHKELDNDVVTTLR